MIKLHLMYLVIFWLCCLLSFSSPGLAATASPVNPDRALVEAGQLSQTGQTAEAIRLLRQAAVDPRLLLADYVQLELGNLLYQESRADEAIEEYRKILINYTQSILAARALIMEGRCHYRQKNYRQAVRVWRELVDNYPDAREAAEARFLIGQGLQALADWREAYQAYAETDLYHPLTQFGRQARLAMKKLAKEHKKNLPRLRITAAALYRQGLVYFDQDDFDMAANIFGRLARDFPKSRYVNEAWLMLGRAELQTSRYPYAIPDLTKATAGEPSLAARAYYYLGLAYGRRGDYDNAIVSLKKVAAKAELADEAAYWAAYYYELKGDIKTALLEYYNMLKNFPSSTSTAAAIWRIGRIYYWSGDYQNAATYLHLAQQFRRSEDAPRCYFFEAKALEKLGKKGAAQATYRKLLEQYDHTYYAYRARQILGLTGPAPTAFAVEDFSEALSSLTSRDTDKLSAIMEIWAETQADELKLVEDEEISQLHLNKYRELMQLGLIDYAAEEARYLVNLTSEQARDTAQTKLGEMLVGSGSYTVPIKYADRKIKKSVLAGDQQLLSKTVWRMAYPRAYWPLVSGKSKKYQLDPLLVLAVIREESRFRSSAVSRSSARGLMQIMPKTGRGLAKSLKLKPYRTARLFEPTVNVELGSCFLADLIKDFRGNVYLALAGYNGGPNRVKRYVKEWYGGDYNKLDIDEFVETIPIRETRLYVQKVMGSYFEYQRLYD